MLVSYNWLKDYVELSMSPESLCAILTDTGLEVEEMKSNSNARLIHKMVVSGEVVSVENHPDAEKLTVCKVNAGTGEELTIICGAPNVAAGQIVPVALQGAVLSNRKGEKLTIKKAKLRGIESRGMICAEDELGLSDLHDGIMVLPSGTKIGVPVSEILDKDADHIIEIAITPNRGDANSYLGVARDIAAVTKQKVKYPVIPVLSVSDELLIEVIIEEPVLCPRYSGVVVSGIQVGESPAWLRDKLVAMGLKPVNNIVDACNFLMFENGQPLHAFDYDKIEGKKIIVKKADAGTAFKTLDETEVKLTGNEIMICDAGKAVAMGGVMGGFDSMVTSATQNILIESAYFNPTVIRKASKYHGFPTDAAYRFERGTDPNFTVHALKRAALLICDLAGGKIASPVVDNYHEKIHSKEILLDFDFVNKVAGYTFTQDSIRKILESLEYGIVNESDKGLIVKVPTYRPDVERPIDLVEEVLRIFSFNKIPLKDHFTTSIPKTTESSRNKLYRSFSNALSGNGFFEIMTPSFTNPELLERAGLALNQVKALNAVNQNLDTLRTDLCTTALETISYNIKRNNNNLKLYEIGKIYFKTEEKFLEEEKLGIWMVGNQEESNWYAKDQPVDFFILKSRIFQMLSLAGINTSKLKQKTTSESGKFAYSLKLFIRKNLVAELGKLKKSFYDNFDITEEVFYGEINLLPVVQIFSQSGVKFAALSKYPTVMRDLAFVIDQKVKYTEVRNEIRNLNIPVLKEIVIFDVYEGDNIEKNKKSYGIRMKFQDENKTLKDEEVEKAVSKVIQIVEKRFNAKIRS